jgi:hypothetical protein
MQLYFGRGAGEDAGVFAAEPARSADQQEDPAATRLIANRPAAVAVPILLGALEDPAPRVRQAAREGLLRDSPHLHAPR